MRAIYVLRPPMELPPVFYTLTTIILRTRGCPVLGRQYFYARWLDLRLRALLAA